MDLVNYIRDIPDFPKKGILYKDISPLLQNKKLSLIPLSNFILGIRIIKLIKL